MDFYDDKIPCFNSAVNAACVDHYRSRSESYDGIAADAFRSQAKKIEEHVMYTIFLWYENKYDCGRRQAKDKRCWY